MCPCGGQMNEPRQEEPLPPQFATDAPQQRPSPEMSREEWIAYHVARAPKITAKQWADTLTILERVDDPHAA